MFTVHSTLTWAVLTGQTDWVCHIGSLTLWVEAVAYNCIIVTWWSGSGAIHALSQRPTGFLQCFDTVGLVIWPVKIVPEMTYNVLSGTLNPTHSLAYYSDVWRLSNLACFHVNISTNTCVPHHCDIANTRPVILYTGYWPKPCFILPDSLSLLNVLLFCCV